MVTTKLRMNTSPGEGATKSPLWLQNQQHEQPYVKDSGFITGQREVLYSNINR